ncbi:MAG: phosphatidylserine decarboxylase family protein [Burkholderiales bacterium]|nr:phosphatidylserine decarboxylase family protein [Burkholderiales bacterium]MCE3268582.1 phosphatidylserine decarboxylase family protein [Burkholderiales bacterium]
MKYYPHPFLAKEGWPFIAISLFITLLIYYLGNFWITLPFILISIFIIQFFRDPKREIPLDMGAILSPADGKIICVEQSIDVYQNKEAIKVSIFMNVFNVHSNRSPVDGEVVSLQYYPGKFVNADFDKASTENERNAMIIKTTTNYKITVVQVAGLIARRILCYTGVGNLLARGERYGFIRFGSRVDLYLPLNAKILVTIGQNVKATETIVAKLDD